LSILTWKIPKFAPLQSGGRLQRARRIFRRLIGSASLREENVKFVMKSDAVYKKELPCSAAPPAGFS